MFQRNISILWETSQNGQHKTYNNIWTIKRHSNSYRQGQLINQKQPADSPYQLFTLALDKQGLQIRLRHDNSEMHTLAPHVYSFMLMISMLTYNKGLIPYLFIRSAVALVTKLKAICFCQTNSPMIREINW